MESIWVYHHPKNYFVQNTRTVVQAIVPASATIAELEKKAGDYEDRAKQHAEPEATKFREEALVYREWMRGPAMWQVALVASMSDMAMYPHLDNTREVTGRFDELLPTASFRIQLYSWMLE